MRGCLPPCRPGQMSLLPPPPPYNQISNWYSHGYNDGISVDCEQYAKLGCNYVMQWNFGWSVATAKKKTAAHTFCTCLCWNKVTSEFARRGQISEFHILAPPNAAPCTVPLGADAPLRPPSRRHCFQSLFARRALAVTFSASEHEYEVHYELSNEPEMTVRCP